MENKEANSVKITGLSGDSPIDYSLRANGDNYIDRTDEANVILSRIKNNSSTVIGLSGVRGTGKSSLALKVLSLCQKEGYFAILIPSPTLYDPKEFLLTVYQNICEMVKIELDEKFKKRVSLEEEGYRIANRERNIYFSLIFFLLIFLSMAFIEYMGALALRQQRELIQARIDVLNFHTLDRVYNLEQPRNSSDTLVNWSTTRDRRSYDSLEIKKLEKKLANFKSYSFLGGLRNFDTEFLISMLIFVLLSTVCVYYILVLRKSLGMRVFSRHRVLSKITEDELEWLTYQISLSSGQEFSMGIGKFTPKFTKSKQMQTRPLSLPGITLELNDYLKKVAQVYNQKIIICLDELDKINDSNQMNELLKGIKGVMGQKQTYFLLTVSEDALAKFSTRHRSERDLLESSFEEIYHLPRIDLPLSMKIMIALFQLNKNELPMDTFEVNHLLVWAYGGGIPREIKRNLLVLSTSKVDVLKTDGFVVWTTLMNYRLESTRYWALITSGNEAASYKFLVCLDEIQRQIPSKMPVENETSIWLSQFLHCVSQFYPIIFNHSSYEMNNAEILENNKVSPYEKGIFEILLSAFTILALNDKQLLSRELAQHIQSLFELINYSPLYAFAQFQTFLQKQEIASSL